MKTFFRFLVAFIFGIIPCYAQNGNAINMSGVSPVINVQSGNWTTTGQPNSLANSYRFIPLRDTTGACLYIINNDTVSHTAALASFISGNPSQSQTAATVAANAAGWILTANYPGTGTNQTLTTGTTGVWYFPISGAALVEFKVVTGGGAGASDNGVASVVQMTNGALCQLTQPIAGSVTTLVPFFPFSCNQSATFSVASGATQKLVAIAAAASLVHVCSYHVTVGGAAVAAVTNLFVSGTGATCGAGSNTVWRIQTGLLTAQNFPLSAGGNSQLFSTAVKGDDLCYTDATTTAGSIVDISFAIF